MTNQNLSEMTLKDIYKEYDYTDCEHTECNKCNLYELCRAMNMSQIGKIISKEEHERKTK